MPSTRVNSKSWLWYANVSPRAFARSAARLKSAATRRQPSAEGVAQAEPAVDRHDADVLDGADGSAIDHPLDRPAIALGAGDQPAGLGEEARLAADLAHQA
jgi:hypothetical protein